MGKTIRVQLSHKEELDATKPLQNKKSMLQKTKKGWLNPNLSSRKEHGKVKQHIWPFSHEGKKGHKI